MIMIEYYILLSTLIFTICNIYTMPPLWQASNYLRAGNQDVILGVTNRNTTPTPNYKFTFSSALSGTPNLGYGIKAYEGWDYLGQQMFQVNRTYLDRFEFRVIVKIKGNTNILHLNVPYIAIDPNFPHHVNSFDNVPVNYSAGNIINISEASTSFKTYTNVINYTLQAAGSHYNTFLPPYSRNKVLLFMTSIIFRGKNQLINETTVRPINITVSADVVSSSQYKIHVQVGTSLVYIQLLHFSIIVFDQVDAGSSGLYALVYDKITLPYTGGFIPIPVQFKDNFIMGMLSFTTNITRSILDFQWNFSIVNGTHGVFMPQSVATAQNATSFGTNTIQSITYTLFYIKTWICPNQTYFDPAQDLCSDCPIIQTSRSGCNTFIFKYNLSSSSQAIVELEDLYFANQGLAIMGFQVNEDILQGNVSYSRDIYKQKLKLVIPSLRRTIVFQHNPLLPSLYFSQQQCKTKQNVQKLIKGIQIASYIILFISLLSSKIVGLQLFGVLQLAYISLASYDFYDMYLYPITQFKSFNGLSILLFSQQSSLPSHLKQMKLSSNFINNCNIMLILLLAQFLVAVVLYMISKLTMSQMIRTVTLHLLKQGFVTLIFFNIINISFSTGIQFKYAQTTGTNFIINVIIIAISFIFILGSTFSMQTTNPTQYGQYKNKFIDSWACRLYIPISFVYRICLGLFIALKNDYEYATLLIFPLSFLFIMYNIINLPFINPIHNYRCNLAHISNLITLFSANYYRCMKKNTPMDIKGRDHSVAILQLVMLVVTLVASIAVLVYEICHDLREYLKKRKIIEQNAKAKNISQSTIQDISS